MTATPYIEKTPDGDYMLRFANRAWLFAASETDALFDAFLELLRTGLFPEDRPMMVFFADGSYTNPYDALSYETIEMPEV